MVEFDPEKAAINLDKHGIDFADVEPVFYDPKAITTDQVRKGEDRHLTTGRDALDRIITVAWLFRDGSHRIISARPASRKERAAYAA